MKIIDDAYSLESEQNTPNPSEIIDKKSDLVPSNVEKPRPNPEIVVSDIMKKYI